jgi:hypothetical protein
MFVPMLLSNEPKLMMVPPAVRRVKNDDDAVGVTDKHDQALHRGERLLVPAMSASTEVSGSWAATMFKHFFWSSGITLLRDDSSAQAP